MTSATHAKTHAGGAATTEVTQLANKAKEANLYCITKVMGEIDGGGY